MPPHLSLHISAPWRLCNNQFNTRSYYRHVPTTMIFHLVNTNQHAQKSTVPIAKGETVGKTRIVHTIWLSCKFDSCGLGVVFQQVSNRDLHSPRRMNDMKQASRPLSKDTKRIAICPSSDPRLPIVSLCRHGISLHRPRTRGSPLRVLSSLAPYLCSRSGCCLFKSKWANLGTVSRMQRR